MNWTTYNSAGAALSQSLTDMPVGTITGYAGATAPSGWLLCDGSAVSRTTYAELFGVVGTTYGSGDGSTTFNVPDSSGFIILASSQAARLAAAALPQYVTSLPSSPVDGQTVVYAADATNGVMWTLRYRAASSSSYKWEFVGGSNLSSSVAASANRTNTAYGSLTPSVTLPLAGDYEVSFGAGLSNPNNGQVSYLAPDTGTPANDDNAASAYTYNATSSYRDDNTFQVARTVVLTGRSASATLQLYYRATGGTVAADRRWISATPVRVG